MKVSALMNPGAGRLRRTSQRPMIRLTHLIALCALALGFGSVGCGREAPEPAPTAAPATTGPVDLSPRFPLREPMRYQHTLTMTQKQRYNEFAEKAVSLQMVTMLRFEVTRVNDDGSAVVELTFDRMNLDVVPATAPQFTFDTEIDHARPETERYVRAIRRIAESAVIYELSDAGQVRSIVGASEIERLVQNQPGFELIAGVLTEPWFREIAEDVFGPAGDEPRRTREDVWTTDLALSLGGFPGAHTSVDWRISETSGEIVWIRGAGETEPPTQIDPNMSGVTQEVAGVYSQFEIAWNTALGRSRSVEKQQAMSLEFRTNGYMLGGATLGTHSLLVALDQ